ncbi:uncharacterized protein LOC131033446 isoform X2 [Cryptomeria japonica]|uniref:uncharacterized protein LOC131033446 isoform X2 n=1 Tax=Cryptomeria japonica TaxID=3369 RepID=UPI0027DA3639|nr:uncharacterized protein LOC131033446 isoform X2 [Cryptomeria japonica]
MALRKHPRRLATVKEAKDNLREASQMGNEDLVENLLNDGADPFDPDREGKTALHYAAEGADDDIACRIIEKLLFDKKKGRINWENASAADKYGRNVLHVAALLGRKELCRLILENNTNIDTEDRDGQSAIYYAVAGPHDDPDVLDTILGEQATNQVLLEDFSKTTPLHVAAGIGNLKMVEKLLSVIPEQKRKKDYVVAADVLGQTALHKAASGGHCKVVEMLLESGAHPLKECDYDGKRALHFAAEADGEDAVKIAQLLLDKCESIDQRNLLFFASTDGIGLRSNSSLDEYLKQEMDKIKERPMYYHVLTLADNMLSVAARLGDIDMTLECLTRGASIDFIRGRKLTEEEERNVQDVLRRIALSFGVEVEADIPAGHDTLGRMPFAIGLAALFSNPLVQSPINVGILGEWGTGKSSVMLQTEIILLKTAAHLAFTGSFQKEGFSRLSVTGRARRRKIANTIERLEAKRWIGLNIIHNIFYSIKRVKNFIAEAYLLIHHMHYFLWELRYYWEKSAPFDLPKFNDFLKYYQPKYHQIFESLAVMDRRDMFDFTEEEKSSQGTTPSILTVQYNAWHYRNETQAWAGLAVEITKELEATMTVAHKLRTSWMYNWTNHKNSICLKVIFPFFLALLVAIFLSIILWLVLGTAHNKDIRILKYGGVPASMIVAAWGLGKSVMSFVKPISSQIENYITLPDHSQNLGYHNKVISDINFLIKQLSYRPSWMLKAFAFIWCYITFSWDENYVPGTKIPKMHPACSDNLRIIVFVDDLDRCEENVILQVLSAVHLALAACKINVIMSMEKNIIKRAIIRKYGSMKSIDNKSNEDLADRFLRKIVQVPLHLAAPSDKDSVNLLYKQLDMWDSRQGSDPAAKKERYSRKGNPKFQIGTSIPEKPQLGKGEIQEGLVESEATKQKTLSISDTTQQELRLAQEQETIEEEGSEVEERTIEMPDIEKAERASLITQIFSYVCALPCLCNVRSHKEIDETTKGDEQADKKNQEDVNSERSLMDDLNFKIMSKVLRVQYSQGEKNALHIFYTQSARSKKLPREWKCLKAYHRLVFYILSLSPDVDPVQGWRVQLIAWIFVCWEWRDLITTLIQKWTKLEVLRNWKAQHGPSLREIVEHYIDERWPAHRKRATKKKNDAIDSLSNMPEKNITTISSEEDTKEDDNLKEVLKKVLKEQEEMRSMLKMIIKQVFKEEEDKKGESSAQQGTTVKEDQPIIIKKFFIEDEDKEGENSMQQYTMTDEEELEEWNKLRLTLRLFNVSMDGIQAFKRFMFNCEPGYLPWPLPK